MNNQYIKNGLEDITIGLTGNQLSAVVHYNINVGSKLKRVVF